MELRGTTKCWAAMDDYFYSDEFITEQEESENSLRDSWEMAFRVILISGWVKDIGDIKSIRVRLMSWTNNENALIYNSTKSKFFSIALIADYCSAKLLQNDISSISELSNNPIKVALLYGHNLNEFYKCSYTYTDEHMRTVLEEKIIEFMKVEHINENESGINLYGNLNDLFPIESTKFIEGHLLHLRGRDELSKMANEIRGKYSQELTFEDVRILNKEFFFYMTENQDDICPLPIEIIHNDNDYWSDVTSRLKDNYVERRNLPISYYGDGKIWLSNNLPSELGNYQFLLLHSLIFSLSCARLNTSSNPPGDFYGKVMEVSLANAMLLSWFDTYDKANFENAKEIINKQSSIYKFGINLHKAGVDWKKWRNSSKDMKSLEEWFSSCFANGDIKNNLSPQEVKSAYDKVFLPQ